MCLTRCTDEYHRIGSMDCSNEEQNENPPPTSEWLEDTLIDLYLSSYSGAAASVTDDAKLLSETGDRENHLLFIDGSTIHEQGAAELSESFASEDISWDEENWRAQCGQVTRNEEEPLPDFQVVNFWDWVLIKEHKRDGKGEVARLVGRLLEPSTKLHPSMSSSGGHIKTAPICEVSLDLVRVKSGKFYKFRSPSMGYISTLSSYEVSNPTKDWSVPELTVARVNEFDGSTMLQIASGISEPPQLHQLSTSKKMNHGYRDRAAERRALHGGFGIVPGQKKPELMVHESSSLVSTTTEEAASEAMDLSFGTGSYARSLSKAQPLQSTFCISVEGKNSSGSVFRRCSLCTERTLSVPCGVLCLLHGCL